MLEQNFLLLGTATGVCNPGSDYDCFDPDGRPFETTVLDEGGGEVVTGIVPATIRILAGYERVFGRRFSAGGRVGFAFGGAPGVDGDDFFPFVGELRAAYFLGRDPLAKRGFRPFVSGALGVAQVDAKVAVNVFANEGAAQTGNVTEVEAWRKTGLIFAAAGVGTAFAVADTQALLAEVRVIQSFGMMGTGLSLNIGYTLGI